MNPLLHWLTSPEWTHVVGALLHSLWQGAILAVALALVLRRLANPVVRYRCALGALGLLLIANLITWAVLNAPQPTAPVASPAPTLTASAPTAANAFQPNAADKIIAIAKLTQPQTEINWTAWIALFWLLGTLLMLIRASIKVAGAEKLRRSCRPLEDERIALLVAEACRAVKLTRKIRVVVTERLTSPAVVGILVPTLILPLSLFTTLTPTQIQFVLLHELAHIRRGDYLANLFQLFAEALWFFNPAVWWISHQIRREREACCDALAIALSGAPADYARTLVHVAENILQPAPAAAPAFGDADREPSSLADRVQRLLIPGYRPTLRLTWRAMATSLLVGLGLLILTAIGTRTTVGAIIESTHNSTNPPAQTAEGSLNALDSITEEAAAKRTNEIAVSQTVIITFSGITEPPQPHKERVKPDGSILLPMIGNIQAAGKSVDQLRQEIHDAYVPTFYKQLTVTLRTEGERKSRQPYTHDEMISEAMKHSDDFADFSLPLSVSGTNQTNQQWFWHRTNGTNSLAQTNAIRIPIETLFVREFEAPPELLRQQVFSNLTTKGLDRLLTDTNNAEFVLEKIRAWFLELGVNLDPAMGKSVYYKDRRGIMLVRATKEELDVIEAAFQKLNTSALPLATRTFDVVPNLIAEAIEAKLPQFRPVTATNVAEGLRALLQTSGADLTPPKSLFYNDRAGGLFVRATKEDLDAIESLLQVIGRQPAQVNIKAVFVELPIGKKLPKQLTELLEPIIGTGKTNFTGILTKSQFNALLRALESNSSVQIQASPQVSTLSGRQAQLQIAEVRTIVSGMKAVVSGGATNLVYESQAMPFGPVLDVLPTVSHDGYTVQMTLTPTFTEFLGYEDPKNLKITMPSEQATFPLPIIRTRQITTSASVWDGQTIVLGNFSDRILPTATNLKSAQQTSVKPQSKQMLVFVTPTIIDSTGNPANKDLGLPSRLNAR